MGRGGEVLPSRDSTRIAKTYVLTLQRYNFFSESTNIFEFFLRKEAKLIRFDSINL